jgi:hypothetical protein
MKKTYTVRYKRHSPHGSTSSGSTQVSANSESEAEKVARQKLSASAPKGNIIEVLSVIIN